MDGIEKPQLFDFKELREILSDDPPPAPIKPGNGVSFSGKSLKLNSEADAKEVCDEIEKCDTMTYLDLEGNTLGPDAAKAISEALETHGSHLRHALWKDMFTGRMKTEIPKALEYLGGGLNRAGARLVELDLSDNAFGPIGIQGLGALLSSSTCYTLRELRLNNNGLGITGGKMLASALIDCYNKSSREGTPLALKVFIAGRNRLENEGAKALADVFRLLGTLEEVVMPQNGIYHAGVSALATALSFNVGLKVLNLNDNTVGPKGAQALADVLSNLRELQSLNLGDCLLKSKGAIVISHALARGDLSHFKELNLTFNEIRPRAAEALAAAVYNKMWMTSLQLDGNFLGAGGRADFKRLLGRSRVIEALGSMEEDATDDDESGEEEESEEEEDEDEEDPPVVVYMDGLNLNVSEELTTDDISEKKSITAREFMRAPIGENLLLIKGDKVDAFMNYAEELCQNEPREAERVVDELLRVVMKVSAHCSSGYVDVRLQAESLSGRLYERLFSYALEHEQMSKLNNNLLVNLGLMKSEDKTACRIDWNLEGCFKALEKVVLKGYFPTLTKDALKLFIEKPIVGKQSEDPFHEAKSALKAVLDGVPST